MKWYFERGAGQEGPVNEEEIRAMVADATTQLGMSNPVNLDGVEDDTDLELMAGKLMNLAENEEFAVKMNEVPGEDGSDIMPDGEAVEDDDELGILEEDDALFMQRM